MLLRLRSCYNVVRKWLLDVPPAQEALRIFLALVVQRRLLRFLAMTLCSIVLIILLPPFAIFYMLCLIRLAFVKRTLGKNGYMMAGQDALCAQDPHSVINILLLLAKEPPLDVVREEFLRRVLYALDPEESETGKPSRRFPRLLQLVKERHPGGYLVWEDDPNFCCDQHVMRYSGLKPSTESELMQVVSLVCSESLPQNRPGWKILVIPISSSDTEPESSCGGAECAVLLRFHHAIADGISLSRIFAECLVDGLEMNSIPSLGKCGVRKAIQCHITFRDKFLQLANFVSTFLHAAFTASAVWARQLIQDSNILHGPPLTHEQLLAWSSPIPLSKVKSIKNATHTTVNDVLLSCLAGALRSFIISHGAEVPRRLTAVIPVTLQLQAKLTSKLTNNFSFVLLQLPVHLDTCNKRLMQTKLSMDSCKKSPDILVNLWFLKYIVNVVPNDLIKRFLQYSPSTLIASNVPGPQMPVTVWNSKLLSVVSFLPHRSTIGMGIVMYSYNGYVRVGVSVDKALIPSRDELMAFIEAFNKEIDILCGSQSATKKL